MQSVPCCPAVLEDICVWISSAGALISVSGGGGVIYLTLHLLRWIVP